MMAQGTTLWHNTPRDHTTETVDCFRLEGNYLNANVAALRLRLKDL